MSLSGMTRPLSAGIEHETTSKAVFFAAGRLGGSLGDVGGLTIVFSFVTRGAFVVAGPALSGSPYAASGA